MEDSITINCSSCVWSMEVEEPDQSFPKYCPECGSSRTEINHEFDDPEETMTDKI